MHDYGLHETEEEQRGLETPLSTERSKSFCHVSF